MAFQYRTREGGITLSRQGAAQLVGFPHWVRLTRRGNLFTAQHSSDGLNWEEARSTDPNRAGPVEIAMAETVHVGLALTSHDARRVATARVSHVTAAGNLSPTGPFTMSEDIGPERWLLPAGSSSGKAITDPNARDASRRVQTNHRPSPDRPLSAELPEALAAQYARPAGFIKYDESTATYTLTGCGKDIWLQSDEFRFAYRSLTGVGSITSRIDAVQAVHPWTKGGVMVRNTLASGSAYAAVVITPPNRVCFQYRSAPGQNALSIHTDPNDVKLPHWVRLIREGNTFRAQHSEDGQRWRDLRGTDSLAPKATTKPWPAVAEVPMNETVHIGLVVTSHVGPIPAEAKMSGVTVTGKVEPPGEFLWSEDIGFQMIMLPKK
jgi:regulation of enolase protein 1 (concanavalin A-like superfamily)